MTALISRKLLQVRPQQLGRVKIGRLGELRNKGKSNEFRLPVKLDHFIVTTNVRDPETGNFIRDERIHEKVGDKPMELSGLLMYASVEENLHTEMVQYKGRGSKGKIWSCDGEKAINIAKGTEGVCPRLKGGECKCKPYTRFHLQLEGAPAMGYHFFRSTSWETTNNLQTALEEIFQRFGTCYHAPVKLVCYPSEDEHDGSISTSHKVGLVLDMSMKEAAELIGQAGQYLEIAQGRMKELAAGTHEELAAQDEAEEGEIQDEFFPPDETEAHVEAISDALSADDDDGPDHEVVSESEEDDPLADGEEEEDAEAEGKDQPALEL